MERTIREEMPVLSAIELLKDRRVTEGLASAKNPNAALMSHPGPHGTARSVPIRPG